MVIVEISCVTGAGAIADAITLAADERVGDARTQLARLFDLLAAEDAIEARRERLRDRRGRAQNVDDDPDRSPRRLGGSECDADTHAIRLIACRRATAIPIERPASPAPSAIVPSAPSACG